LGQRVPLIGVCGPIGAGKTTVVAALADELGFGAWPERVEDNPFFERYLEDRARWAFHSQAAFMVGSLQDAAAARIAGSGGVIERPSEEMLEVFGRHLRDCGALDDDEFRVLSGLHSLIGSIGGPPDVLILLVGDPGVLLERIRHRARPGEAVYTLSELEELDTAYSAWCKALDPARVLEVDTVTHDFRSGTEIEWLAEQTRCRLASTV